MQTTVVNKETRPDLFYLPQDKLVDGKTVPILDVDGNDTGKVEQEYTVTATVDKEIAVDYDLVKRKSAKGVQEHRAYSDRMEVWHDVDGKSFKLAEHAVYLEYKSKLSLEDKWTRSKASFSIDETSVTAEDDVCRVEVDSETGKQTFLVGKKGYLVRCVWDITRYAAYEDCFDDLRLDYSDYKGKVEDTDWVENSRTITFEAEGVADKLVVDPYISVATTSTTITVDFDSGDSVVWTITTTNNATLIESNSIRVCVHEDYFRWYAYDGYLLRWQHDTAASTTDAAFTGNTYCTDANKTQIGSYNYYFYPATSDNNTNKTTLAAELADTTTTISTGTAVTDLNWPDEIGTDTDGACYDGAFHVKSDSNNAGKLTIDRTRNLLATVIHDWPIMSGDPGSPTEHLTGHFKLEQAYDTTKLYDEVSETNVGGGADTVTFDDGVRGNCLVSDSTSDRAYIPGSYIYSSTGFSICFDYYVTNDLSAYLKPLYYEASGDGLEFTPYYAGGLGRLYFRTNYSAATLDFTSQEGNVWHSVIINIDITNQKLQVFFDGKSPGGLVATDFSNIADPVALSGNCYVGYMASGTDTVKVDNLKIYDTPILPYGSFIPSNIISGDVGYDMAHSDITAYVHGDEADGDSLKIGSSGDTITVTNATHTTGPDGVADSALLMDATGEFASIPYTSVATTLESDNCTIAFWYKKTGTLGSYNDLLCHGSNYTYLYVSIYSGGDIYLYWSGYTQTVTYSSCAVDYIDGNWHHWKFVNDSDNYLELFIDGISVSKEAYDTITWGTDALLIGNYYSGHTEPCMGAIHGLTITSDQNTSQLWTANGSPLVLPDFKSEVA